MLTPTELDKLAREIAEMVAAKVASRPRLVDRYQLADILGCSVPTVERLQSEGLVPVIRLGRAVRYDANQVVEALTTKEGPEMLSEASSKPLRKQAGNLVSPAVGGGRS